MAVLASCGDSSEEYKANVTTGTYTYSASIKESGDIVTKGASSGASVDIIGAPMEGEEVTVVFSTPVTSTPSSPVSTPSSPVSTPSSPVSTPSSPGTTGWRTSTTQSDPLSGGMGTSWVGGPSNWPTTGSDTTPSDKAKSATTSTASSAVETYDKASKTTDRPTTVASAKDVAATQEEPDKLPPTAPTVTGTTPISDTTPTWAWAAGTGGNGTFRYKLDNPDLSFGATETTSTSWTPRTAIEEAVHTLYVQEGDDTGNWSDAGSRAITIDATGPAAPTVSPTAGTYNMRQAITLKPAGDAKATFWTTSGGEPTNNSAEYKNAITIDGDNGATVILKVVSYDALGNKGPVLTATYVFKKESPTAPTATETTPGVDTTAQTASKAVGATDLKKSTEPAPAKEEPSDAGGGIFGCSLIIR